MSLLCTHMGCTVRWEPDLDAYRCPCHFGRYDADGRVLGGHPPAPLRRFRWRVEGNVLVILPDYEA
jgi:menaquinol-cytochrome c reductase iron-sulfur subunit